MINKFRTTLEKYALISDKLWQEILESCNVFDVPKNGILVHHQSCLQDVYFILKGSFKTSQVVEDGKRKAIWFHFADHFGFVGCPDSVFLNEPTKYEITALEDSTVIRLEKVTTHKLIDKYPEFSRTLLKILEQDFAIINEVRGYMISYNASDFYKYLKKKFPHMLNRVPSYAIAEFMGITPEWLSKLMKKQ